MNNDEELKKIYEEFAVVIRDAQVSAFNFAKKAPTEKDWMLSVLRNLSCTTQILEHYMLKIFNLNNPTKENKNGEN